MHAWSPSAARRAARRRPRAGAAPVVLVLGGLLAGCGGDSAADDPTDSAADVPADGSSASSSPSPSADVSPSPGASPSPDAADSAGTGSPADPASEGRLTGEGYALTLPAGWQDATAQFREYSPLIDAGALDAEQSGRAFSDNVNVLRNADQPELPPAQAERQFAEELATVASRVRVEEPATVAGVDAVHLTGRTRAGEVVAHTDQYICWVDDASYVITFSYGDQTPPAQRQEEVAAMLASWTWG